MQQLATVYTGRRIQCCCMWLSWKPNNQEVHCRFKRDEGPLQPSYQKEQRWKRIPPLNETIEAMRGRDYLPAIWFIFSRAGCDKSARQAFASGARLTTPEEQAAILALVTALK